MREFKQGTVNLVIIIAAIVVAAGAWSAPLLTVQTTHNLISADIDDAITSINTNTDSETGEIGSGFFGSGTDIGDSFGDCTMMDLLISIALDENVQQLCDPDDIQNFIESDIHFGEFKDQFAFDEQFLEVLPMKLLPDRDCAGGALTEEETYDPVGIGGQAAVISQGTNAGFFGAITCIQSLSFEDAPLRVKAVTLDDFAAGFLEVRLQLALIDTTAIPGGQNANCGDPGALSLFNNNTIFDGMFGFNVNSGAQQTVSGDLMIVLPPDGNTNICARVADSATVGTESYQVFLTVQEVLPLNVINFAPPAEFQFFEFEHFAPIDFTDTCTITVKVEDFAGNDLQNIPVTLLDPFISATANGPANANQTTAGGLSQIGFGLPSAFYVIDVNVDEPNLKGSLVGVNNNFGQGFPDTFVSCTIDDGNTDPALGPVDDDGVADGTFTILSQLPQFGGGGFIGADIGVFAENSATGAPIPNIQLVISGVDFSGNAIVFDGVENFQTTDSFGEVEFEGLDNTLSGLPGGEYTITFTAAGGLQGATTVVFIPPGASGFFGIFLPISPT